MIVDDRSLIKCILAQRNTAGHFPVENDRNSVTGSVDRLAYAVENASAAASGDGRYHLAHNCL